MFKLISEKITPPQGFKGLRNCPGWFINRDGDVWSANKCGLLSPHQNGTGYKQLIYGNKNNRKKHYIHRLVVETFIGEIPSGYCVNHIDGDKTNNNVNNLEIVTRKYNNLHAIQTGLNKRWRGEAHPNSKLTEDNVREIRLRKELGESSVSIANDFNICAQTVNELYRRDSWKWLD